MSSLPFLPLLASEIEGLLLRVLVVLAVIILAARLFANLFRKLGQPAVVGEIAAGIVLGPSVLGKLGGGIGLDLSAALFTGDVLPSLKVLSQLGLIFLLFLIGLEFDFSHLKARSRAAVSISLMGIALPFALGWGLAHWLHPYLERAVDLGGFALFMGTAMSITAIPILGRIMMELNITRTRIGALTITAAAVDDAAGWILLAAVSAMVRGSGSGGGSLWMMLQTLGFALGMILLARPLLVRWARWALRRGGGELGLDSLATLLVLMFLCAMVTSHIGIFAIFGAFLLGAVLSSEGAFRAAVNRRLSDFVTAFFLPIFFTLTGLQTDIGTLHTPAMWGFAVLVSVAAIVGKFGGCTLAARAGGFPWREAACIGVMMNTRALMELIVVNAGHELGVIPGSVFCMLVGMALLTTVMTAPLLLPLSRSTELEPLVAASRFRPWWQRKRMREAVASPM